MDIVAHALWAGAAGACGKRRGLNFSMPWAVWWSIFPDVLAFGPMVAAGLWMWLRGELNRGRIPRLRLGLPLYPLGHSLVTFTVVFAIATLALRKLPLALIGWLSHILIDICTHGNNYYATHFLWPLSGISVNGIPWWTPWFWVSTYCALAVVYWLLWRAGWLRRPGPRALRDDES